MRAKTDRSEMKTELNCSLWTRKKYQIHQTDEKVCSLRFIRVKTLEEKWKQILLDRSDI